MPRLFQVAGLAERKKLLVAQSDVHRQTLLVQLDAAQHAVAQFKHRFALLGISSLALSIGASVAGVMAARKHAGGTGGGGFFSKIFSAFSTFNQIKGLFNRFKPPGGDGGISRIVKCQPAFTDVVMHTCDGGVRPSGCNQTMKAILFVDDEPLILEALERSLSPMNREWHMRFAVLRRGGVGTVLEEEPADVVIFDDMRMPLMSGAELLNGSSSATIPGRSGLILSGFADMEMILRQCIEGTHQFLAVVQQPRPLKNVVGRALAMGRLGEQ